MAQIIGQILGARNCSLNHTVHRSTERHQVNWRDFLIWLILNLLRDGYRLVTNTTRVLYNSFYHRLSYHNILISQQNRRRCYKDKNSKLVFCRTMSEVHSILIQFIHIFLTTLCSKLYRDLISLHFAHNKTALLLRTLFRSWRSSCNYSVT